MKVTNVTVGDIKELYEDGEYDMPFENFLEMFIEDDDFLVVDDLSCSQIRQEEVSEEEM